MLHDRRSFIRRFGITLGSLIASGSLPGCGDKKEGGSSKTEGQVKEQDKPSPTPRPAEWEQLRQCWLKLDSFDDDFGEAAMDSQDMFAKREAVKKERAVSHRALLDTLVAKGELKVPVAQHIPTAFEEAVNYVDYLMPARKHPESIGSCYLPMPIAYGLGEHLLEQTYVLRQISADLDPAIVAQAQAAIAQDVAFFELFRTSPNDYGVLKHDSEPDILQVSPEALEAARLLARLFLETSG
jgi:hypothetical protein